MRKLFVAVGLAAVIGSASAHAQPPEIASAIHAEKPYGTGTIKLVVVPVYDAALWTDAPQWSMTAPFALSLTYHMGFSSAEIVARSEKEMRRDDPALSPAALAAFGKAMARVMPSVARGDRVTGLSMPGGKVEFFHNGRATGAVGAPGFAKAFFGIWLSPRTTEPALRTSLLRGHA
jgi:hypothetical protein